MGLKNILFIFIQMMIMQHDEFWVVSLSFRDELPLLKGRLRNQQS